MRPRGARARPTPAWTLTLMLGRLSGDEPTTAGLPGWVAQAADDAVQDADGWDYTPAGDRMAGLDIGGYRLGKVDREAHGVIWLVEVV